MNRPLALQWRKKMIDEKGFWSCDISAAANRKLSQQLNEEVALEAAADAADCVEKDKTWDVERIVSTKKVRGKRTYEVKWEGFSSEANTHEPEAHVLTCRALLIFWRDKKPANKAELQRVTKLQEAALREKQADDDSRRRRKAQPLQQANRRVPIVQPASSLAIPQARSSTLRQLCARTASRASTTTIRALGRHVLTAVLDSRPARARRRARAVLMASMRRRLLQPAQTVR